MIIDKAKLKALVEQGSLPPIITALIEEIERLEGSVQSLIQMERNTGNRALEYAGRCDQLRAEVAGLETGYEAYERVNAELKAENEALRNALRPLLAHWDDVRPGESLNVDAARAAMGKGEQS